MSKKFTPGTTEPCGDCGKFAAYIDYMGERGEPWLERIRVLGHNPQQAEHLRDRILAGLAPEESAAAWNGEGLPPAGLEVEWKQSSNHEWVRATVIAYFKEEAWISVKGAYPIEVGNPAHFRPIRTPEHIAAEEREKAILELTNGNSKDNKILRKWAEYAYDQLGYRKQVAP